MDKMKEARRVGPYFGGDLCLNIGYAKQGDCSLLNEYLEGINMLRNGMLNEGRKSIEWFKKFYCRPSEKQYLNKEITRIRGQMRAAQKIFGQAESEVILLYNNILINCPHGGGYNLALTYNEGLIGLVKGDYETTLQKIDEFVLFAETTGSKEELLNAKIYQQQGDSLLELGLYHQAIASLSKSIAKDPKNKDAYVSRAAANFEIGDFDSAVMDYRSSGLEQSICTTEQNTSEDFNLALLEGILAGGVEATVEFVPSLCNTVYGMGECIWCFVEEPITSSVNFYNACADTAEAFYEGVKNLDQEVIDGFVEEVKVLYQEFETLDDGEKGRMVGYCLGKYEVDIFACGTTVKCISAIRNLKNANRISNLESLVASKETVKKIALAHAAERNAFFKNVKIHYDRQNKHVPGRHNFEPGKSVFEHNDPQGLLDKFAGKGRPKNCEVPGTGNYREVVDFQENIGIWKSKESPMGFPTTKGTIHYSKDGAHIVPAHPDSVVN